jgi:hypothetical protein
LTKVNPDGTVSPNVARSADPRVGKPLDPNYIQQINRHVLLTRIIAEGAARNINGKLDEELSDINDFLDEHLYTDPYIGQRRRESFFAQHDDKTNTVLEMGTEIKVGTHTKRHIFPVRTMVGERPVYAEIRKKDPISEGLKSLKKAVAFNKGWVDVTGDVQDNTGMQIVALDGGPIDPLMDNFVDVLAGYPAGIRRIEEDDDVNKGGGQAENTRFRRLQIWIGDMPVPFEVKFEQVDDHLNSQVEVGEKSPKTGLYSGRAHSLYELRRIHDVMPILFPRALYKVDTLTAIKQRMDKKAQELREMDIVDLEAEQPSHLYG